MKIRITGFSTLELPTGELLEISSKNLVFKSASRRKNEANYEIVHHYTYSHDNNEIFAWEVCVFSKRTITRILHKSTNAKIIKDFNFSMVKSDFEEEDVVASARREIKQFAKKKADERRVRAGSNNEEHVTIWVGENFPKKEIRKEFVGKYSFNILNRIIHEMGLNKGSGKYIQVSRSAGVSEMLDWVKTNNIDSIDIIPKLMERFHPDFPEEWVREVSIYCLDEGVENSSSPSEGYDGISDKPTTPDQTLNKVPKQELGFNFGLENGKAVYQPAQLRPDSEATRLHDSLLLAVRDLFENYRKLDNKSKKLLNSIDKYYVGLNRKIEDVDPVEMYVLGIDFDTEFKMALKFGGDDSGLYPELDRDEEVALTKLSRKHAAYIESTPEGSYFTEMEKRHYHANTDEQHSSKVFQRAIQELLKRPDLIDKDAAQRMVDLSNPAIDDPNATRKRTLSRIGLRNFLIVAGIGTAISTGGGTAIGFAVTSVAGSTVGTLAGTFSAAGLVWVTKQTIQKTKTFKDFTEKNASRIDLWLETERPMLRSLAEFFIEKWELFRPTLNDDVLDEWFENIHRQGRVGNSKNTLSQPFNSKTENWDREANEAEKFCNQYLFEAHRGAIIWEGDVSVIFEHRGTIDNWPEVYLNLKETISPSDILSTTEGVMLVKGHNTKALHNLVWKLLKEHAIDYPAHRYTTQKEISDLKVNELHYKPAKPSEKKSNPQL